MFSLKKKKKNNNEKFGSRQER